MKLVEGSTVIGKSVTVRGKLTGGEDLFLDGIFEGTIDLPDSRLTIGPNAKVTAEVHVRDMILFGVMDGNVQASGRIELRQASVMNGDLLASRLSIEESASIRGKVELTGAPLGSAAASEPSAQ